MEEKITDIIINSLFITMSCKEYMTFNEFKGHIEEIKSLNRQYEVLPKEFEEFLDNILLEEEPLMRERELLNKEAEEAIKYFRSPEYEEVRNDWIAGQKAVHNQQPGPDSFHGYYDGYGSPFIYPQKKHGQNLHIWSTGPVSLDLEDPE